MEILFRPVALGRFLEEKYDGIYDHYNEVTPEDRCRENQSDDPEPRNTQPNSQPETSQTDQPRKGEPLKNR